MKRRLLLASFGLAAMLLYFLLHTPLPRPVSTSSNSQAPMEFAQHVPVPIETTQAPPAPEAAPVSTPPKPRETSANTEEVATTPAAPPSREPAEEEKQKPDESVVKNSRPQTKPTPEVAHQEETRKATIASIEKPKQEEPTAPTRKTETDDQQPDAMVQGLERVFNRSNASPPVVQAPIEENNVSTEDLCSDDKSSDDISSYDIDALERILTPEPKRIALTKPTPVRPVEPEAHSLDSLFTPAQKPSVDPTPEENESDALVEQLTDIFPGKRLQHSTKRRTAPSEATKPPAKPTPTPPAPAQESSAVADSSRGLPPQLRAERQAMRALARKEGAAKLSAIFRLEPQDEETMSGVITQYGMEALIAVPSHRVYFTIAYRQSLGEERTMESTDALSRRFGLSVNHLSLPWLDRLRDEYVSSRLVPRALVEASLLVPTAEAEVILGRIVDGCREMSHDLDEVQACYGTFVAKNLAHQVVYRYELTRLILRDGREVRPITPPSAAIPTSPLTTL